MSSLLDMDTATRAATSARAVVCAGGIDTTYIRVGRGDPVVLLVDDIDAVSTQELQETLSARFVVFAAAPGLQGDRRSRWLADFIEARGVTETNVMLLIACAGGAPHE